MSVFIFSEVQAGNLFGVTAAAVQAHFCLYACRAGFIQMNIRDLQISIQFKKTNSLLDTHIYVYDSITVEVA